MSLEEVAKLYDLLVKFSVEEKIETRAPMDVETIYDKAAVQILQGAIRREEIGDLLALIEV